MEEIAFQLTILCHGMGDHFRAMHVLEGLHGRDARQDRFSPPGKAGPHVGLDKARQDLQVCIHVEAIHKGRHLACNRAHLHHVLALF